MELQKFQNLTSKLSITEQDLVDFVEAKAKEQIIEVREEIVITILEALSELDLEAMQLVRERLPELIQIINK